MSVYCVASEKSTGKIPWFHQIVRVVPGSNCTAISIFQGVVQPSYIQTHERVIWEIWFAIIFDSLMITGLRGRAIPLRLISPIFELAIHSRSQVLGLYCTFVNPTSQIFSLHPEFVRVQLLLRVVIDWAPQSSHTWYQPVENSIQPIPVA